MLVPFPGPIEASERLFCVSVEGCVARTPLCVERYSAVGGLKQQNMVIMKLSERHVTIIAPAHLSLFENFIKKKEKCLNDTV